MRGLAIIGAALAGALGTAVLASDLRPFDMENIPLAEINLQGGSFEAQLLEADAPFKSQLYLACTNCATDTNALVGVSAAPAQEVADFQADAAKFIGEIEAICVSRAERCDIGPMRTHGLEGYGYTAHFSDGYKIVEHIYYGTELMFIVNAVSISAEIAEANVQTLIDVAGPYVTGAKQ